MLILRNNDHRWILATIVGSGNRQFWGWHELFFVTSFWNQKFFTLLLWKILQCSPYSRGPPRNFRIVSLAPHTCWMIDGVRAWDPRLRWEQRESHGQEESSSVILNLVVVWIMFSLKIWIHGWHRNRIGGNLSSSCLSSRQAPSSLVLVYHSYYLPMDSWPLSLIAKTEKK